MIYHFRKNSIPEKLQVQQNSREYRLKTQQNSDYGCDLSLRFELIIFFEIFLCSNLAGTPKIALSKLKSGIVKKLKLLGKISITLTPKLNDTGVAQYTQLPKKCKKYRPVLKAFNRQKKICEYCQMIN